ncbi:MAG: response regulator [Oscillospiraceae bacterium]|jgi:two-component system response regulator YesN|nr:response regulator [Oscillospiraceae bacterium]
MLKVLIVDDEPHVRQGLKMMIPWDELGIGVVGEGEDGDDGLKKIIQQSPDIVIADVKMPGRTGIQMLEAAQKSGFEGKALILSGYSDFSYAKEAISLGVKQFILKPVDEKELIESLSLIRDEILKERENAVKLDKGDRYINDHIVKALLLGDEETMKSVDLSSFTYPCYDVALISAAVDTDEYEQSRLLNVCAAAIRENSDIDIITTDLSGMLAVLFKGWKRPAMLALLHKLNSEYDRRIFITVGSTAKGIYMIKQSYLSANTLYKNRFLYLHYGVVAHGETPQGADGGGAETDEAARQIYAYVEINDIPKLEASLEQFQETLRRNGYPPERIKVVCITLVMDLKSKIAKSIGEKKAEQLLNDDAISAVGAADSLYKTMETLRKLLSDISNAHFSYTTKSTMERVVQYIKANYAQELKLEMLAGIFGYNSAYLGKVFHQYTGENFNNYLDGIRITEAKRLLSEGEHKVYEVAEMVGYSNINYFHNKFQKHGRVSPLNYKRGGSSSDLDNQ